MAWPRAVWDNKVPVAELHLAVMAMAVQPSARTWKSVGGPTAKIVAELETP